MVAAIAIFHLVIFGVYIPIFVFNEYYHLIVKRLSLAVNKGNRQKMLKKINKYDQRRKITRSACAFLLFALIVFSMYYHDTINEIMKQAKVIPYFIFLTSMCAFLFTAGINFKWFGKINGTGTTSALDKAFSQKQIHFIDLNNDNKIDLAIHGGNQAYFLVGLVALSLSSLVVSLI